MIGNIGVLASLFLVILSISDASYFEQKLLKDLLFKDFRKDMRPVLNDNDTITVKIGLTLSQIIDVDEKNQIMTTSVWTRQEWYNPYLRWNKSDYGNITSINVKSSSVWLPDLVLYNNADASIDFRGNLDRLSTRIQLYHDGKNKWLAPVMLTSKCKINVEYFPFDTQLCSMKFGSWTYDGYRVDVQNESDSADLQKYVQSGEWHLASAQAKRNVQNYICCPEPYPDVTFYFKIQRRSLFYLTNLIVPLVVISALIIFVFTLPPQSGERISLSITLLLSMTVFMLFISETIPATSDVVPLIAKFYMAVMLEMAMALITTCYVLRCYHSSTNEVPHWMKVVLVKRLANLFGVKKSKALLKEEREEGSFQKLKTEGGCIGRMIHNGTAKPGGGSHDRELDRLSNCMLDLNENTQRLTPNDNLPNFLAKCKQGTASDEFGEKMLAHLEIISSDIKAKEEEQGIQEQWLVVATVIDRLAMYTFTLVIAGTIFTIFYQAPGYVS